MRKVFAFLVMLVFIIVAAATLYAYNASVTLLDSATYKDALKKSGLYTKSYDLAAVQVKPWLKQALGDEQAGAGMVGKLVGNVKDAEMADVLRQLLPPAHLQAQLEAALDSLFAWFRSSEPAPNIVFNLRPIKEGFPAAARRLIATAIRNIPECKPGQGLENFPDCRPAAAEPDMLEQAARRQFGGMITEAARALPDQVTLAQVLQQAPESQQIVESLRQTRQSLETVQTFLYAMVAISVGLFALLALLALTSPRSLFGWLGAALLGAGLLTYLPTLALPGTIVQLVEQSIAPLRRDIPAEVLNAIPKIVGDVLARFMATIQMQSIVLMVAGGAMVVVALLLGLLGLRRRPPA